MSSNATAQDKLQATTAAAIALLGHLRGLDEATLARMRHADGARKLIERGGQSIHELERVLRRLAPAQFGAVDITLGRADGIARFFAFSFMAIERLPLDGVSNRPFLGSGVYALYYHGAEEEAYAPISGSETPLYVGKADPSSAFAETLEDQGKALHGRLKEHARNISKTKLPLADFSYRAATIQSGMQYAVEEFMIRLFHPVWNKDVGVCHGFGKHGDSAGTRRNRRSPWDTMHPGRKWATDTTADQVERAEIMTRIRAHFAGHPVFKSRPMLMHQLSLR